MNVYSSDILMTKQPAFPSEAHASTLSMLCLLRNQNFSKVIPYTVMKLKLFFDIVKQPRVR